jgi:hypothetical protein
LLFYLSFVYSSLYLFFVLLVRNKSVFPQDAGDAEELQESAEAALAATSQGI